MSKVNGSLKSLLQGVSQQPPRDRLPGQCTEMINMTADPVSGLARRAPTDLVGSLGASADVRGFHHFETRDGNKFIAYFHDATIKVVDYNCVAKTVTIHPDATSFLSLPGTLRFGTVENQVVVINRSLIPALKSGTKAFANKGTGSSPMGIIQVLGGQYGREYRVNMNGTLIAMYKPPDGSAAAMVDYVRTTLIADRLYTAMTTSGGVTANPDGAGSSINKTGALSSGYTVTRYEDIILIKKNTAGEFQLTCADDQGNTHLKVCTLTVPAQADVPRIAPNGYLLRIATETDPEEDLFLEFVVEEAGVAVGAGFGKAGYWQETVSSEVDYQLDLDTMPHILEYDPIAGDFEFRRGNWKDRRVGTDVSNPKPSFIGSAISDVSTFQSRLVLLSGSFVCMSRTNRYDDFWMGSASQLVDSDPIDISSTAVEASTMLACIPNNRDLVVFSQKGQFIVFGRSALTPANATLVLTTTFEAELAAKPAPAGRNVFFATNYGRFTGIREFYTEGGTDINDARPITQHVKEYLVGRVSRLIASSNYDTLVVQTQMDMTNFYVYQYIWNDNEKLQSSWSKWILPYECLYMFFDEETIYYIVRHSYGGTYEHYILRMSLDIIAEEPIGYPVYLDARFDAPDVYTAFVLPFDHLHDFELTAVQGNNCPNPGLTVPIQSIEWDAVNSWYTVTLKYDMGGGDIVVGVPFRSEYRPTMPIMKDKDGNVVSNNKLRIKKFMIEVANTGHLISRKLSKYGDGEPVVFEGRLLAAPENVVGMAALYTGVVDVPFREESQRADFTVYTTKHLPMTFLGIDFVGQYTKSGQRISTG